MVSPPLNLCPFNLHGSVTAATDEVVVVLLKSASAITYLPVVSSQNIDISGISKHAKLVVDRRQPHSLSTLTKLKKQLLSRAKSIGLFEQSSKRALLLGLSLDGGRRVSGSRLTRHQLLDLLSRRSRKCVAITRHDAPSGSV
jgi:hypothetical protein